MALDDKSSVWNIESGNNGYLPGDYNMDGQVDNEDKNEHWESNFGAINQVPD
ncbi:MAG: hypothetical protein K9G76_09800 [Bacteroidales bacterium]|nr:hypothetical protein [Bacteroidales bacterium]MCF8403992.1 hypothetical protein [Bacteroidales bacterium]